MDGPMEIPPRQWKIYSSRWIRRYVTGLFALTLVAIVSLPVGKLPVFIMVVGLWLLWRNWRRAGCHSGEDWQQQIIFANDSWLLKTPTENYPVYLHSATVWQWLVVMNFRGVATGRRHDVLLLPDSIDREQLRRLRVVLRYLPVYGLSPAA